MILQALTDYYDILLQQLDSDIPVRGYSRAKVSYALSLSPDGEILNVIPLFVKELRGKKVVEVPQTLVVPEQIKRASGIVANCLCENSTYSLGIDNKGKPERSEKCFQAFAELHRTVLANVDCPEAKALLNFLDKWNVAKALECVVLQPYLEQLLSGVNIVFKLEDGEFLHQNKEICRAWDTYKQGNQSATVGQCLITGEVAPIAILNPAAKGIRGGQSTGCSLVSFNAPSYLSYGKAQGENAPISERAAFAYGTALNYLLADHKHRMYLGDATVVYWAYSTQQSYQDAAALFFMPDELEKEEEKKKYDPQAVRLVDAIMEKIAQGEYIPPMTELDPSTQFYVLGLSPNAARVSVRFFTQNNFGEFVNKLAMHYQHLQIEKQFGTDKTFLPLWQLLSQTVSPNARDKACSPLLAGSVLRSILEGTPYPSILFSNVMLRIKAGDDINYAKASIIKAYLIRKRMNTEVLTMSLNTQTENVAYELGRLFAVLEKLQQEANGSSNIRERYFSSFSSTPAVVFPILLKLAQHHIAKIEYGYSYDNKINDILDKVDIVTNPIPKNLSLEDQGTLVLGYYHQRNDLYKKKAE